MAKTNSEEFIKIWMQAKQSDQSMGWVAEQLGVSRQSVYARVKTLRVNGVELPLLKHGNLVKNIQKDNKLWDIMR